MNRIKDLFGDSSSLISKNRDEVIKFLNLDALSKVQFLSDRYGFIYNNKKYSISTEDNKSYTITDGTNDVVFINYRGSSNLAEAIASRLVKYGDNIYKVICNNHPGFESTNLYYFSIEDAKVNDLLMFLSYMNNSDNKLYRSFKMSYNNFLKLSVVPDNLTFDNPKIISSLEVNIDALIDRLDDEDKSEITRCGEFINGVFLDNRSQSIYELIKSKKPVDKISVLVVDDNLKMIDGIARLAVLNTLGYPTIEALIYGDIRSLVNH